MKSQQVIDDTYHWWDHPGAKPPPPKCVGCGKKANWQFRSTWVCNKCYPPELGGAHASKRGLLKRITHDSASAHLAADALLETGLNTPMSKLVPPPLPITNDVEYNDSDDRLADAAYDFLESEVGRFDWHRNWPDYKKKHGDKTKERVASWLRHFEMDHDPDAIVKFLDDFHGMHPKQRWL